MMGPDKAVAAVVAELRAADIRASDDPRDLNPPCVWVTPETIRQANLCGGVETVVGITLMARDSGSTSATEALAALLDSVLGAVEVDGDLTAQSVTLPSGGPLPAFTGQLLPL